MSIEKGEYDKFISRIGYKYRKLLTLKNGFICCKCGKRSKGFHIGHWNVHFKKLNRKTIMNQTKLSFRRDYKTEIFKYLHQMCSIDYNLYIKKYDYLLRTTRTRLDILSNNIVMKRVLILATPIFADCC